MQVYTYPSICLQQMGLLPYIICIGDHSGHLLLPMAGMGPGVLQWDLGR